MTDRVDDVAIVGGGDVGLLTALAVRKRNPAVDVRVIDDFGAEIPQVGKSTYLDIQQILHGALDIDELRFIPEVKPVWKASVFFRDWCGYPPFHYPFDASSQFVAPDVNETGEHLAYYYHELSNSPDHLTRCSQIVEQGASPWYYGADGDLDKYGKVAYHLETDRFNPFLRDVCRERGISLVDDAITAVETTGSHVDGLRSDRQRYEADLYVDATGFGRVLRREQDVAFEAFEFPLDAALNVGIDRPLSDVVSATVIETGDHGWFWQIDTYDNRDLGYVYASEYVDEDGALDEFREFVDGVAPEGSATDVDAAAVDKYEFTSGYYPRAWADNCLAIGNAGGFVEPLQSTALTANAALAVEFADLLAAHARVADDAIREAFNRSARRTWESIRDFIAVHYLWADGDTAFWQRMTSLDVSPRVDRIQAEFDRYGYQWDVPRDHADGLSELDVFTVPSFFAVMRPMGATSRFYETADITVSDAVERAVDQYYERTRDQVASSHLTVEELYRGIFETGTLRQ